MKEENEGNIQDRRSFLKRMFAGTAAVIAAPIMGRMVLPEQAVASEAVPLTPEQKVVGFTRNVPEGTKPVFVAEAATVEKIKVNAPPYGQLPEGPYKGLPHYTNVKTSTQRYEPVYLNLFDVQITPPSAVSEYPLVFSNIKKIQGMEPLPPRVEQIYKGAKRRWGSTLPQDTMDLTFTAEFNLNDSNDMFCLQVLQKWSDLVFDRDTGAMSLKIAGAGGPMTVSVYNRQGEIFKSIVCHNSFPLSPIMISPYNMEKGDSIVVVEFTMTTDYYSAVGFDAEEKATKEERAQGAKKKWDDRLDAMKAEIDTHMVSVFSCRDLNSPQGRLEMKQDVSNLLSKFQAEGLIHEFMIYTDNPGTIDLKLDIARTTAVFIKRYQDMRPA